MLRYYSSTSTIKFSTPGPQRSVITRASFPMSSRVTAPKRRINHLTKNRVRFRSYFALAKHFFQSGLLYGILASVITGNSMQ